MNMLANSPYTKLSAKALWKTGAAEENPCDLHDIYKKKFIIDPSSNIVTAGSCFAQHITSHLIKNGYNVLDAEPAPYSLPQELHQASKKF